MGSPALCETENQLKGLEPNEMKDRKGSVSKSGQQVSKADKRYEEGSQDFEGNQAVTLTEAEKGETGPSLCYPNPGQLCGKSLLLGKKPCCPGEPRPGLGVSQSSWVELGGGHGSSSQACPAPPTASL